jgi:membrane-bound serine protease (ClpP class)
MSILVATALAIFVLPLPLGIAAIAVAVVLESAEIVVWWRLRGRRARTGAEAMVGEVGEASTALDPIGRVRIRGEIWRARAPGRVERGHRVRVVSLSGLTLEVESDRDRDV